MRFQIPTSGNSELLHTTLAVTQSQNSFMAPIVRTSSAELESGVRPRSPVARRLRCPEPQRNHSAKLDALENGGCSDMRVSVLRRTHSNRVVHQVGAQRSDDVSNCSTPKSMAAASPRPVFVDRKTRHTVAIVATTVVSLSVLVLLALCAIALAGNVTHAHTIALDGKPVKSRSAHLLAEGLASLASRLDNEAVEEYAPNRGYIRKALEATKRQMEIQRNDIDSLQEYYDSQLKHMQDELKLQKGLYEKQLSVQGKVLDDIFGNEDAEAVFASAASPEADQHSSSEFAETVSSQQQHELL